MKHLRCGRNLRVFRVGACVAAALLAAAPGWAKQGAKGPRTTQAGGTAPPAGAKARGLVKIAHIPLRGRVLDSPRGFALLPPRGEATLADWLKRLALARNDVGVGAVALEVDRLALSWAQAQELADAVRRLEKVKPVYAHVCSPGPLQYLVASAAREVSMDPAGALMITGLGMEVMFFRGTLELLGIEPQLIQVGRFKGAAEPFTRKGPSDALRQEYNALLDDLYDQLCTQIARQRRLTVLHVKQAIDEGPLGAADARKHRMVDRLVEKLAWPDHVGQRAAPKDQPRRWVRNFGATDPDAPDLSNLFVLLTTLLKGPPAEVIKAPAVAIIHADGMIVSGRSGEGLFGQRLVGAKTMVEAFESVRKDDRVKAVIFRINSPGGSAQASETIYQAVAKCARAKPVIASVSQVAGSGGYYVAAAATTILADPAAITGSIGVLSGKFALTGLFEKLGITTFALTRGANAGMGLSRAWTERELAVARRLAERIYARFLRRVEQGRGKKIADLDAVAQGRVFTARQAVANGLVDRLGGFRDAVIAAHQAAKIKKSTFFTLPRPRSLIDVLSGDSGAAAPPVNTPQARLLAQWTQRSPGLVYLLNLADQAGRETVLAAMPAAFSIR